MAKIKLINQNENTYEWCIEIELDKKDLFYADYFNLASDHPNIIIDSWRLKQAPRELYDSTFKHTKKVIDQPVDILLKTSIAKFPANAHIHLTHYRKSHNTIEHELIPIVSPIATHTNHMSAYTPCHYSLLKKKTIFYTPQPIVVACALVATLVTAQHCLKRNYNFRGIMLYAFAAFLSFQLAKSIIINRKKMRPTSYTHLSSRKQLPFKRQNYNRFK